MLRSDMGEFIKRRREEALMSQEELALRAKLTARTIYALEAGGTTPQFKTLRAIAGPLGISPRDFLEREEAAS